MSATSTRGVTIVYSGDVGGTQEIEAATNTASPAMVQVVDLAAANNTIAVPTGATALTIMKPSDNTAQIMLKGVNGDTGVGLHLTDPDSVSLQDGLDSLVLQASDEVTVRLFWS